MKPERTLIVGGGIAGLTAAASLARAGIPCEIVERTPAWAPIGAGIVMSVNAMQILRGLGLDEEVARRGHRLGEGAITDHEGRALGRTDFDLLSEAHGPTIAVHRAALHDALLSAARDVPVHLGTSIEKLSPVEGGVDVVLTNGRAERFDLVIGADGLHSKVRELGHGKIAPRYSGYTCWRFVVRAPVEDVALREMWGRGQRFGIVRIDDERLYCFAVANAPRGSEDPEPGRLARLRERFSGFGGQVPEILAALDEDVPLIHNDLEELPRFSWVKGRVALIGDAAHALTPNMGLGAAMAMEDAAVLADEVAKGDALGPALEAFYERRRSRVDWVQNQSRRIGRVGQLENRLLCGLRNLVLKLAPDDAAAGALRRLAEQPV